MVAIALDFDEVGWESKALSCLAAGVRLMRVPEERLDELTAIAARNGIRLDQEQRSGGTWVHASSRKAQASRADLRHAEGAGV